MPSIRPRTAEATGRRAAVTVAATLAEPRKADLVATAEEARITWAARAEVAFAADATAGRATFACRNEIRQAQGRERG